MPNKLILGENDFKTYCINHNLQYLLDEWDYEKNETIPEGYTYGSSKKVWWKCPKCTNEYEASLSHRRTGTDCPKCKISKAVAVKKKNRIAKNDTFAFVHPEMLNDWDYEKNAVSPDEIPVNYHTAVWWKCKLEHSWKTHTHNRLQGKGCPYCAGKKVLAGYNDLATLWPEILDEWDYEKNIVLPTEIVPGCNKKVYWKCKKGHSWSAAPNHRRKSNCPYCGNKKIIPGENDLATTHPYLVDEWNYDKNIIKPTETTFGSATKVWWKCKYGHEWQAKVCNRVHGTDCPYCTQYMHTSFQEQAIYYYIQKVFSDAVSRDWSHGFEIDIFIPEINCAIEYDGQKWHKDVKKDIEKINKCVNKGLRIIRVREPKCPELPENICETILMDGTHEIDLLDVMSKIENLLSISFGEIELNSDRQKIYARYSSESIKNSLEIKFPEIAAEWHPDKNHQLKPSMVFCGTSKKVWWKCRKDHEWQTTVSARTGTAKSGCPICSNRICLAGYNDIATTAPNILKYWDYEKNDVKPTAVTLGYKRKKLFWKCPEYGHEFEAYPLGVAKATQPCPYCGKYKTLRGFNDFYTCAPKHLIEEWNYEKNIIDPWSFTYGANVRVWWKCKTCGYEWEALTQNRLPGKRKNTGCPKCADISRAKTRMENIRKSGNSLKDRYPEIAAEWHPTRNKDIGYTPETVATNSHVKAWWLGECGHE